jgi:hypothetical protein
VPCRPDFVREQIQPLREDVQNFGQLGNQAYGKAGGRVRECASPKVDGGAVSCDQVARPIRGRGG